MGVSDFDEQNYCRLTLAAMHRLIVPDEEGISAQQISRSPPKWGNIQPKSVVLFHFTFGASTRSGFEHFYRYIAMSSANVNSQKSKASGIATTALAAVVGLTAFGRNEVKAEPVVISYTVSEISVERQLKGVKTLCHADLLSPKEKGRYCDIAEKMETVARAGRYSDAAEILPAVVVRARIWCQHDEFRKRVPATYCVEETHTPQLDRLRHELFCDAEVFPSKAEGALYCGKPPGSESARPDAPIQRPALNTLAK